MKYGLQFDRSGFKWHFIKQNCEDEISWNNLKEDEKDDILGFKFVVHDYIISPRIKDMSFKFLASRQMNPPAAVKFLKTHIVGKFRYYHEACNMWSERCGKFYYRWFKNELDKWIRKTMIVIKIPLGWINVILNGAQDKLMNFYCYWMAQSQDMAKAETEQQDKYLARWQQLCKWTIPERRYIGIYSLTNFIFDKRGRTVKEYYRDIDYNEPTDKQMERTAYALDLLYNAIMTEQNVLGVVNRDVENKIILQFKHTAHFQM